MNKFAILHAYRRLVRRGKASAFPLMCQTCAEEYSLSIGDEDRPVLKCFYCGSSVTPGDNFYKRLAAVVSDFE